MTTTPRDPDTRTRERDKRIAARVAHSLHRSLKRENWYRDIWLFVISGILLWSVAIAQDNANQAKTLAVQIQGSRIEQCQRDNLNHTNTIAAFGNLTNQQKARAKNVYVNLFEAAGIKLTTKSQHALQKFVTAQLQSQSKGTIALINAISPKRNCSLHRKKKKAAISTAAKTRK